MILQICEDLNISKPASPAINFRDSINHFVFLYEVYQSNNEIDFIMQLSSIKEHLNRGIKDALVFIFSKIIKKIQSIIKMKNYFFRRAKIFTHILS